ncbi:MAG: carboxypeptidase-like regulatory domain-containing protein [Chitinophagaceae bacterium]|nr:carboxypeptidase-like regulatory domain-containing protein [Chitinophagaceae bacterium]
MLLLISTFSYAQQVKGIIEDSISGEKISYATVYIKNIPSKGCYSNANGVFNITCSTSDTLCIIALGYKKIFIPVDNTLFNSHTNFKLIRENKLLPEVVVTNAKRKTNNKISVGFHKRKKEISSPAILGGKIIVFIDSEIKKDEYIISKLFFSIAKPYPYYINRDGYSFGRKKFSKGSVRILLYDADTVNNAGNFKRLLPEDIICEAELKNYLLKADVSKFNIAFPDSGVYLGLEWLGEKDSDTSVMVYKYNIAPEYFSSRMNNPKSLISSFANKFYDPYEIPENKNIPHKDVPNFGLELIKID